MNERGTVLGRLDIRPGRLYRLLLIERFLTAHRRVVILVFGVQLDCVEFLLLRRR